MSSRIGRRGRAVVVCTALVAALSTPSWLARRHADAAVGPRDRKLTNLAVGLSVEAPAGWTLSQHTGYRDTVVLLLHPDGSRISVNAAPTPHRTSTELLDQNLRGLTASGMKVLSSGPGPRGALLVDLGPPPSRSGGERLRQAYLVRDVPGGRQAIVLTLVCRENVCAGRTPALEFVLTRMAFDDPTLPAGDARNGSALPAAGGSGGRTRAANGNGNTGAQQPDKR
jgi:hypothetical protein